jgi:signal peptidase I
MIRQLFYIVIIAAGLFAGISGRAFASGAHVEGSSMEPTLHDGQYVMLDKTTYSLLHGPHYGDIIVFRPPIPSVHDYIKRVIGTPGDSVEIRASVLYINDQPVNQDYLKGTATNGNYPRTVVPDDQYFVLGDNRNNSSDSRIWGFVPRDHIEGKVMFVYWPVGSDRDLHLGAFGVSVDLPVPF